MNRRRFIKLAGEVSASSLLFPARLKAKAQFAAKVYEVHNTGMVNGTAAKPAAVNKALVKESVNKIVKAMGNNADLGKAWESLLPGITLESKVGIKVNCLKPETSPQFCTLEGIVFGLLAMFKGKFKASQVFLFDNNFELKNFFKPAHVDNAFGAHNLEKLGIWHGTDSYNGGSIKVGEHTLRVSTKWAEAAATPGTTCISFLCPRPHLYFAGHLSGHIKNMMGAVSTTRHKYNAAAGVKNGKHAYFHDQASSKYFVDLHRHMKPQTALYISDMIFIPNYESGNWDEIGSRIAFASDPCAADSHAVDRLHEAGYVTGKHVPTKKTATDLQAAGLGTMDYEVVVPVIPDPDQGPAIRNMAPSGKAGNPRIVTMGQTREGLTFRVEGISQRLNRSPIRIVDSQGKIVRNLKSIRQNGDSGIYHWGWRGDSGKRMGSGTYFFHVDGMRGALGKIVFVR